MDRPAALKTLSLKDPITEEQLKASYRRLAKTTHPDKGGNNSEFLKVKEAYNYLNTNFIPPAKVAADRAEKLREHFIQERARLELEEKLRAKATKALLYSVGILCILTFVASEILHHYLDHVFTDSDGVSLMCTVASILTVCIMLFAFKHLDKILNVVVWIMKRY